MVPVLLMLLSAPALVMLIMSVHLLRTVQTNTPHPVYLSDDNPGLGQLDSWDG